MAERNGGIHATAPVLAAALAVAEERKGERARPRDGAPCRHRDRLPDQPRDRRASLPGGFHATGTLSTFGAAAAAAMLRGLDREKIGHALAFAASAASGVRQNFGSMVEIIHPGLAAEAGVLAADLAARGLIGAADALGGKVGYFEAAGGGYDPEWLGRLGDPWAIVDPGMWIKPFPQRRADPPGDDRAAGAQARARVRRRRHRVPVGEDQPARPRNADPPRPADRRGSAILDAVRACPDRGGRPRRPRGVHRGDARAPRYPRGDGTGPVHRLWRAGTRLHQHDHATGCGAYRRDPSPQALRLGAGVDAIADELRRGVRKVPSMHFVRGFPCRLRRSGDRHGPGSRIGRRRRPDRPDLPVGRERQ